MFRLPQIFRPLRPSAGELRVLVDELPLATRIAMLEGVRSERIITGAYADGVGGVCPMLAAHRCGGSHSHPEFARTWDEFACAPETGFRDADPKTVAVLVGVLQDSIEADLRTPDADDTPTPAPTRGPAHAPAAASRPTGPTAARRPQVDRVDEPESRPEPSIAARPHELVT